MNRLYFLILLLSPFTLLGQNYSYLSTHGGSLSDHFLDVIATNDSGYAAVGVSSSFSSSADVYIVKFDKNNVVEWSRIIGGLGIDWGYAVSQLPDSGFAIAGFSSSFSNGDFDGIIFRTDKLGFNQGHYLYGGADWDFFYDLAPTIDSGFIACGKTYSGTNGYSDSWVVKLNKNMLTQWDLKYGGTDDECANKIIQTYDSNYVFCGTTKTNSSGVEDTWLVKLNGMGDTLFTRSFGDSLKDEVYTVIEHNIDSGLVLGGKSNSFSGNQQSAYGLRLKYSKTGQFMWYHAGGGSGADDIVYDLSQFSDGKLIGCGQAAFGAGLGDVATFIVDQGGWYLPYAPTYGGIYPDYARSVAVSLHGKYVFAGSTSSFGAGLSDGLIIIADSISNNYTATNTSSSDTLVGIQNIHTEQQILCFPNPASDHITFASPKNTIFDEINIYDMQGRELFSNSNSSPSYHVSLRGFSCGMYIAILKTGAFTNRVPFAVYR